MGYDAARSKLQEYRGARMSTLLGERAGSWFLSLWNGIGDMLSAFGSSDENKDVAAKYAAAETLERIPGHVRLDYVCGLRREVRKQYVSGEDGVYTDVTPFRHGVISANGARIFDDLLDTALKYAEAQAKGGGE